MTGAQKKCWSVIVSVWLWDPKWCRGGKISICFSVFRIFWSPPSRKIPSWSPSVRKPCLTSAHLCLWIIQTGHRGVYGNGEKEETLCISRFTSTYWGCSTSTQWFYISKYGFTNYAGGSVVRIGISSHPAPVHGVTKSCRTIARKTREPLSLNVTGKLLEGHVNIDEWRPSSMAGAQWYRCLFWGRPWTGRGAIWIF